ncbi:MAG: hypothetical protein DMF95_19595 [Acidobacteria bacterium]|nr:MAG: hypothetical protein DMF96_19775 [Acidobacteriota bacterium]PYR17665.1 MAG: hypothetical protein DMF94_22980 [Acidobacteriota bacterium]PYR45838.1 MAG: hypothetical protein DMF95_19595 [Acidobacteriota bacterium]
MTTENVAHVEPAGTTTLTGTAANAGLLDDRFTVVSDGAGLLSVIVPTTIVPLPPLILDGDKLSDATAANASTK